MFEAFRERMGRRALEAAVLARTPSPLAARLRDRSLLIVLPASEEGLRVAWPFVDGVDVPRSQLSCLVASDRVAYAPDRFAGSVQRVDAADLDWRGLPRAAAAARLRGSADVAINLAEPGTLVAEYLVGTSPAAVRIGRHSAGAEAYYDLMLAGTGPVSDLVGSLRHTLDHLVPPLLPLR